MIRLTELPWALLCWTSFSKYLYVYPQASQTLFVIYIRDSIALRFEPFKRMYENGSKIQLVVKDLNRRSLL